MRERVPRPSSAATEAINPHAGTVVVAGARRSVRTGSIDIWPSRHGVRRYLLALQVRLRRWGPAAWMQLDVVGVIVGAVRAPLGDYLARGLHHLSVATGQA